MLKAEGFGQFHNLVRQAMVRENVSSPTDVKRRRRKYPFSPKPAPGPLGMCAKKFVNACKEQANSDWTWLRGA